MTAREKKCFDAVKKKEVTYVLEWADKNPSDELIDQIISLYRDWASEKQTLFGDECKMSYRDYIKKHIKE